MLTSTSQHCFDSLLWLNLLVHIVRTAFGVSIDTVGDLILSWRHTVRYHNCSYISHVSVPAGSQRSQGFRSMRKKCPNHPRKLVRLNRQQRPAHLESW